MLAAWGTGERGPGPARVGEGPGFRAWVTLLRRGLRHPFAGAAVILEPGGAPGVPPGCQMICKSTSTDAGGSPPPVGNLQNCGVELTQAAAAAGSTDGGLRREPSIGSRVDGHQCSATLSDNRQHPIHRRSNKRGTKQTAQRWPAASSLHRGDMQKEGAFE
jgi:hypothetical protein